jgi:galactose mutarotase-like enzyme
MFPFDFKCTFTVTVTGTSLDTSLVVANTGKEDFDFQAALHSYYDVSDISKASVARDGGTFVGASVRPPPKTRQPVVARARKRLPSSSPAGHARREAPSRTSWLRSRWWSSRRRARVCVSV